MRLIFLASAMYFLYWPWSLFAVLLGMDDAASRWVDRCGRYCLRSPPTDVRLPSVSGEKADIA